jgi:hypothetical protein
VLSGHGVTVSTLGVRIGVHYIALRANAYNKPFLVVVNEVLWGWTCFKSISRGMMSAVKMRRGEGGLEQFVWSVGERKKEGKEKSRQSGQTKRRTMWWVF